MKNEELKSVLGIAVVLIIMMVLMIKYQAIINTVGMGIFIIMAIMSVILIVAMLNPDTKNEDC